MYDKECTLKLWFVGNLNLLVETKKPTQVYIKEWIGAISSWGTTLTSVTQSSTTTSTTLWPDLNNDSTYPTNQNRKQAAKMDVQMFHHLFLSDRWKNMNESMDILTSKALNFGWLLWLERVTKKRFWGCLNCSFHPTLKPRTRKGRSSLPLGWKFFPGRWSPQPQVPLSPQNLNGSPHCDIWVQKNDV